jgi:hypothetical protein
VGVYLSESNEVKSRFTTDHSSPPQGLRLVRNQRHLGTERKQTCHLPVARLRSTYRTALHMAAKVRGRRALSLLENISCGYRDPV